MITQILDRLYVGDSEFTQEDLDRFRITNIINVGGVNLDKFENVYWMHLSDDGKNEEWRLTAPIHRLEGYLTYSYSFRVLVCCRAGISRSTYIVIRWLQKMGMSRDEAYEFIKKKHPIAQVNLDLLRSV